MLCSHENTHIEPHNKARCDVGKYVRYKLEMHKVYLSEARHCVEQYSSSYNTKSEQISDFHPHSIVILLSTLVTSCSVSSHYGCRVYWVHHRGDLAESFQRSDSRHRLRRCQPKALPSRWYVPTIHRIAII